MSMTSQPQTKPPSLQRLESIAQQHLSSSNSVNLLTQLSIDDSCSILPTTSTQQMFTCQTKPNTNGKLSFPVAEENQNAKKHSQKMSWHNLLKYLKSQRIVNNIEIFNILKRKHHSYQQNSQQFPFVERPRQKEDFPCLNIMEGNFNAYTPARFKQKEIRSKKSKFPLNLVAGNETFPFKSKQFKEKIKNFTKVKKIQIHQLDLKSKQQSKIRRSFKEMPRDNETSSINRKRTKTISFQGNSNSLNIQIEDNLKFPTKLTQNFGQFPLGNSFKSQTVGNFRQQFLTKEILKSVQNNQTLITIFPCEPHLKSQLETQRILLKFPLQQQYTQNLSNWNKVNNSNNSKTSFILPSLLMTQNSEKKKSIDNEHVSQIIDNEHVPQVQDAQVHVEKITRPLAMSENIQPPPQATTTTMANRICDDRGGGGDICILKAINSINNTQPNEVGYYAEKIELVQDAIVALFERIKNSLRTNHNSEHESTNAANHDHDNGISNTRSTRFALTPPMSVTSVQNTERTDNNKEVLYNKYDYGDDLCDREVGQIVECSDVRETLFKAVDYGVTKEQIKSTGSFLVKSEEPASPISPYPNPLNESAYTTSLEDNTNASELLPKYNVFAVNKEISVDVKDNLKCDPIKTIDTPNKLSEIIELETRETEDLQTNSREKNLTNKSVCEMTVTRFTENEPENTNENDHLEFNEALENKNNILCNDIQIDEMKFEMNRVKGAFPSSVSKRSPGKHENLIAGNDQSNYNRHSVTNPARLSTDPNLSSSQLPYSLTTTRNYNDSSHTPRPSLSLKKESSTLPTTISKRSTLNTHLPQEGITNRSVSTAPALKEPVTSRAALSFLKTSNDPKTEAISSRRPSLGALRNTQSTSLLSVDLPHYTPLSTLNQPDRTSSLNRAASIDSSLENILPERTRFRRQRRLRTQDEPDDPIERLNLLKARISASLSEVKGVLKQYSAEDENENENQSQTAATLSSIKDNENEKKEGPVTFRFIKKVRRRSLFAEEDEDGKKDKELEKTDAISKETTENQTEIKDERDNCKLENRTALPTQRSEIVQVPQEKALEEQANDKIKNQSSLNVSLESSEIKNQNNLYTLKEEVQESLEHALETKTIEQNEVNKTSKDKSQTFKNEQQKLKEEPSDENGTLQKELPTLKEQSKGAIPKPAVKNKTTTSEIDDKKTKKKIIIKSNNLTRRASLAAVEGSKIEPPVKVAIPAKIHRRPSDSEALVKKKLITAKLNTSGIVEEVTPKPKIVKVKRSSFKNESNNTNSQLATTQTKLKEETTTMTAENYKSDDFVKSLEEQNKSIHNATNKDVVMPKQPERQQQKQQQQINNAITSQTNILLPTQLVIDEAASLNVKTIKNSVLTPRQQQKQQEQGEQEQQATIKSTTTNFKSNDLQPKSAMLENLTTVLSSSTDSEANSQIKREKAVPAEDLHDLLQLETTIIKPSTTAIKQNELKEVKQVENNLLAVKKDILLEQESNENLNENLKIPQTTKPKEPQQKSATQDQQVIVTTDVEHSKIGDENNRNEDVKNKISLKEPCQDKTATSTHVGAEQQQQQQTRHQLLEKDEQSITNAAGTKTISSPHISISSKSDHIQKTTTETSISSLLPTESLVEETAEPSANQQQSTMPELQLAPAPVQTAEIIPSTEHHKKKVINKKIVRHNLAEKNKKPELEIEKPPSETEQKIAVDEPSGLVPEELTEECSESTEISESSTSLGSEEVAATQTPKKERRVKKKVIIKRQKRRLSISDSFFQPGATEEQQNAEIETLEKPIAYVSEDEDDVIDAETDEEAKKAQEQQEEKKPLKSCILHKEYNIGDEVLYAERFKKTQIKWRRGRIKERITSISYLLDIDGKDVSSHINYLKKFTGRKVSFGGKEYLEIDYEQLAEEEEKAERLQRRSYSIWNMV